MTARKRPAKRPATTPRATDAPKIGRPSRYDASMDGVAMRLALLGKTDPEIAHVLGVGLSTLSAWKLRYPTFWESLKKGKAPADGEVAESLHQRALGYSHPAVHIHVSATGVVTQTAYTKYYPPDTLACIYWLNNRQRDLWYNESPRQPAPSSNPKNTANDVASALRAMRTLDALDGPPVLPVIEDTDSDE